MPSLAHELQMDMLQKGTVSQVGVIFVQVFYKFPEYVWFIEVVSMVCRLIKEEEHKVIKALGLLDPEVGVNEVEYRIESHEFFIFGPIDEAVLSNCIL